MIKINLLPREVYAAKAQKQFQSLAVGLAAVVVLLLMGYYFHLSTVSKRLEKDLTEARGELQRYETIDREVKEMQVEEGRLSSRLSVSQDLLRGTLTYPKFFEDFMALLPSDVWVQSVSTTTDGAGGLGVTVNAQALSSFAVADWLTNLLSSSLCNSVRLGAITVTEQNEGTSAIYSFTMTFNYRGQS